MNPITPHGAVIVNASYDFTQFTKATTSGGTRAVLWQGQKDDHRIEKKDMVFRHKGTCKRKRTSYNDPDLHVFGVCNGLEGESCDDARKDCSFIGVSNTHLDEGSHRHASITIAGMTTITNTGSEQINAGDKLVWDVPAEVAVKSQRQPFRTMPYDTSYILAVDANRKAVSDSFGRPTSSSASNVGVCTKAFNDLMSKCGVTAPDKRKEIWDSGHMKMFLDCYVEMSKAIDARVIGTALSKAQPGNPFDILLRHSH
jgi:hypothetical protein